MENTSFEHKIDFVRYVLAGCSDRQLEFARLTPKQRDALLEKPMEINPFLTIRPTLGEFNPALSYRAQATVIGYNALYDAMNEEAGISTAAHELYHAASFWGQDPKMQKLQANHRKTARTVLGTGLGLGVGVAFHDIFTAQVAVALSTVAYDSYLRAVAKNIYKEEKNAFRFGKIFDYQTYQENELLPYRSEKEEITKIGGYKSYPNTNEIVHIFNNTQMECCEGNPIFPLGEKGYTKKYDDFLSESEMVEKAPRISIVHFMIPGGIGGG